MVKTSRLFARTAAKIDPAWLETLGGSLWRSTYLDPHWDRNRGEVIAYQQLTLYGLVIIPGRPLSYGSIDPEESHKMFVQSGLVEGNLKEPLPFLIHNHTLIKRVASMESEEEPAFALGPGAEVLWRGAGVARLVSGESALSPQVEVLASDLLDPPLRERVRRRLATWLEAHLRSALDPLFVLRDGAPAGAARGLAFALAEGLGAVARRAVARQVEALTPDDRRDLSRLGVTTGRLAVFLRLLLQPPAMRLRARLFWIHEGRPAEAGPDGPPSVPRDPLLPAAFYLACGYFPAGPRAARLDRLEHAAAVASRLSR